MKPELRAALKVSKTLARNVAAILSGVASIALSAPLWFLALAIGSALFTVHGVRSLAGDGWAQIAAGGFLLLGAALVRKGMTSE